jgi:hypothetical protein
MEDNASDIERPLLNNEILELATEHELHIFIISIDGSLVGISATVSISIIALEIRDFDTEETWQTRPAKVLFIRSWKLPECWGTG